MSDGVDTVSLCQGLQRKGHWKGQDALKKHDVLFSQNMPPA